VAHQQARREGWARGVITPGPGLTRGPREEIPGPEKDKKAIFFVKMTKFFLGPLCGPLKKNKSGFFGGKMPEFI